MAQPNIKIAGSPSSPTGRHLVSTKSFGPGDLIETFDSPLIAIPETPRLLQVCSNCLSLPYLTSSRPDPQNQIDDPATKGRMILPPDSGPEVQLPNSKPVKACTGCNKVAYCSQPCQREDWKRIHKGECKVFIGVAKQQEGKTLPTPVRAGVQLMLRYPELKRTLDGLEGHANNIRNDEKLSAAMSMQASAVAEYSSLFGKVGQNLQDWTETCRGILCKIQTNAFHRLDSDLGQDGIFLDPLLAMVNHSCIPNAIVYFLGRNAYLKAKRPIGKGEEISISYIDYTHPKYHRLANLRSYYFVCTCPRCKGDLNSYDVCKSSPNINLNQFSLQPDLSKYSSPPSTGSVSKSMIDNLHREFAVGISADDIGATLMPYLSTQWKTCKPLVDAELYAIQPLPQIFSETMSHCSTDSRYVHALCIAAFQATHIEPYLYPHPFAQARLKTCLVMAKLLVNIIMEEAEKPQAWVDESLPFHVRLRSAFKLDVDPILLAQAMLIMVVHYAKMAHNEQWNVAIEARGMLKQFEGRPDREQLTAGLLEWERDPASETGKGIFEFLIGKPLRLLAVNAIEVMDHELGKDFPQPSPQIY